MEGFHKYVKVLQLGHDDNKDLLSSPEDEICLQEKVDGGNLRFMFIRGNLIFGSRNQQITSDEGEDTNVSKNFVRCIEYIRKQIKLDRLPLDSDETCPLIFYGENMIKHSIGYDWEKVPPFLGFDIYDPIDKVFLNYKVAKDMYNELGLPFVPIIKVCKAKDIKTFTDKDVPTSQFYGGPCEGVVFKNCTKQIYGKYVTDKFKEVNRDTFGKGKKYAKDDTDRIVATYCTNPRIDKIVFKLIDEGVKLEIKMMELLPTKTYEDIMEENWKDIVYSKDTINFRELKKKISHRCLVVLRQIMTNNALNKNET